MTNRLVALDEGSDIPLDRVIVFVGRSPQCDVRLDSLRVSRHHCCMTLDHGEVHVRDLGSTNGIRINGHRVESGRLKTNDELSIAHIRYRLVNGQGQDATLADARGAGDFEKMSIDVPEPALVGSGIGLAKPLHKPSEVPPNGGSEAIAAAVRDLLAPAGMADRCFIQVIVKKQDAAASESRAGVEREDECRQDFSP